MRVVFFGSGVFGLPTLKTLFSSRHKIAAIVTQPDKVGRGHHRHFNPIKDEAEGRTRPVLQPENVNDPDVLKALADFGADLFLTAAYGQLLQQELLDIPPLGCLNLHASLLPKYRGAAPIHAALRKGETETGISIFRIVRKLDAGPILSVERTTIGEHETTGQLHDRLAELAAPQTIQLLDDLDAGRVNEVVQDDALATYAPQMRKEEGRVDWTRSAVEIVRHVRGMTPWPGAFTDLVIGDEPALRVLVTQASLLPGDEASDGEPGIVETREGELRVVTGEGLLRVDRLKPAGKGEMEAGAYLRGKSLGSGARFV